MKIFKRKGSPNWQVRYLIPTVQRKVLKRSEVWRSTRTSDKREAQVKAGTIWARLRDESDREYAQETALAAGEVQTVANDLLNNAEKLVRRMKSRRGGIDANEAASVMADLVDQLRDAAPASETIGYVIRKDGLTVPCDDEGRPLVVTVDGKPLATTDADIDKRIPKRELTPQIQEIALGAMQVVQSGQPTRQLSDAIERHIEDRQKVNVPSTVKRKQIALDKFKDWHGDTLTRQITEYDAGQYVDEVLLKNPDARANLQSLSAAWNFFKRRHWVDKNIWEGFGADLKGSTRGVADKTQRRPWEPDEVEKLVVAVRDKALRLNKTDLRSMFLLGLYTGARREEIAGARLENVDTDECFLLVLVRVFSSCHWTPLTAL